MLPTIAIDDEPLALQLVAGYIEKTPGLDLVGKFDNPLDAFEFMASSPVDLIFLDIQMPDLTGIEFARAMTNGPKVIFTTAFEKYALEGFKLDVVDYLLKPFGYEDFFKSAQKALRLIKLERGSEHQVLVDTNADFLFLKSEYKIRRINFNNILYIEGLKDYVKVFTTSDPKPILSLISMKHLEEKLPSSRFMRVHRSFIVNLDKINTIERSRIIFGKVYIPVSDQYKDKFQEFLDKNFL